MLKYRINKNNVITDEDKVHVNAINVVYGVDNEQYQTKCTAICRMDNMDGKITQGTKLVAYHNVAATFEEYGKTVYPQVGKYTVAEVNNTDASFSFDFDKYVELPLINASKATIYEDGADGKPYLYMYFSSPHFFDLDEPKDNNIWLAYGGKYRMMAGFEILTNDSIRFSWDTIELKYSFINDVMRDDSIDNTLARVFRKNYAFTSIDKYELYYGNPKCKITLGLSNMSQIDLLKEQKLVDYVADAKRRSINGIVDYEKDIYYPVAPPNKEGKYDPIWKIRFNLHFREHRGDDWTVEPDTYWNGTYKGNDGKLYFIKDDKNEKEGVENQEQKDKDDVPQSYFPIFEGKEEYQSDLLSYLGFSDSDVRYQKSRLKKSFLRLSFFDSTNPANQNMLAYSTIFMNSGDYFNKYVRFMEEKPYLKIVYKDENDEETNPLFTFDGNLKGVRVDREPYDKEVDKVENYRMSSQFVVTDKYNSTASSEGFYLYLFRDLLAGLDEEQLADGLDIYMKVEFNHAGYGRTIPFMMPYWDFKKTGRRGIKTFQEILDDWNGENASGGYVDGEYGIRQYEKFSYIHFKINYDENEKKYIYYLDKDCYGDSAAFASEDNELTLNLYEAKMA